MVVGSLRERARDDLGGLRGYQVHAQTVADLMGGRTVRPAGWTGTLPMVVVAALVSPCPAGRVVEAAPKAAKSSVPA